jgi:hypothetical protein
MHVLTVLLNYIVAHEAAILSLLGGSAGVSAFVQGVLHSAKVQGVIKSFFVSHVGAFLAALATYAISGTNYNVGVVYLLVWFISQFWHRLAINPVYNRYFLPFLEWMAAQKLPATTTTGTVGAPVAGSAPENTFA